MSSAIRVGIIGLGRMGRFYAEHMENSSRWQIVYICDTNPRAREWAKKYYPTARVTDNEDEIFGDESVSAVGLFALADSRSSQIFKALAAHKHIIAEKPIAEDIDTEWKCVHMGEAAPVFSTVNLYLRNSWYHNMMRDFIASGEIGELAIIRVCHLTPGLVPGEGHEYEGPSFHDCGMHYVDITRWYAGCEFRTWNAQAMRMWDYKDPWWLQCHGTMDSGVVFDITQGHVYGQLSKDQTHNSYIDLIGTKGIARMTHDFQTARVELHGTTRTVVEQRPFGGKNIDVLCDLMADSISLGEYDARLPTFRDSAIASEYAWKFLENAGSNSLPSIGSSHTLDEIRHRRRTMENGYGLLNNYEQ